MKKQNSSKTHPSALALKTQGNSKFLLSAKSTHDSRPWTHAKAAHHSELHLFFCKQIKNHYNTVLHFFTTWPWRQPGTASMLNSKTNPQTRHLFPTECVFVRRFKQGRDMLLFTKSEGRQSAQHMWNRQGNSTVFPEIAKFYIIPRPTGMKPSSLNFDICVV